MLGHNHQEAPSALRQQKFNDDYWYLCQQNFLGILEDGIKFATVKMKMKNLSKEGNLNVNRNIVTV